MGNSKSIEEIFEIEREKKLNEAYILQKIKYKKSSEDFTKEETDFIFSHKKLFDHILFSPINLKGEINHNYLKGFKLKNKKALIYKGFYSNIGFYQDVKPTSKHYGGLSWSIKTDNITGKHDTSWWLNTDEINKTFIPNKNIEWEDPRVNKVYLNTDYSKLYINKQNNRSTKDEEENLTIKSTEDNIIIITKTDNNNLSFDRLKEITNMYAKNNNVIWNINLNHKKLGWISSEYGFRAYEERIGKEYIQLFDYINSNEFKNNHNDVIIFLYTDEDDAGYVKISERGYKRNVINLISTEEISFDRELISYT